MKSIFALLLALALLGCADQRGADEHAGDEHGHATDDHEFERGPHGGRLLKQDDFALELTIFESGVPPEFHVWLYENAKPLSLESAAVTVTLTRLGGETTTFEFAGESDYLRGNAVVKEPHSFDVEVVAVRNGKRLQWRFASYEGRTQIATAAAASMGVTVSIASAATLKEQLSLAGTVQADPARISRVRARYAGVVREIAVEPLSAVARGALLAQIQSNESFQNYPLVAPIAGTLVEHRAQVGEATGDEPLFTIIDVSKVWVELDVFQSELARIELQQPVALLDLDRKPLASGHIGRLAPLTAHGSQSVRARVVIDNAAGSLRPGQFVTAQVTVGEASVPLAVERTALQRFREFDVVFERVGETYEVRMVELGRADATHVEVLSGLAPGAEYVTGNSYLIKADIEKSGASHDH